MKLLSKRCLSSSILIVLGGMVGIWTQGMWSNTDPRRDNIKHTVVVDPRSSRSLHERKDDRSLPCVHCATLRMDEDVRVNGKEEGGSTIDLPKPFSGAPGAKVFADGEEQFSDTFGITVGMNSKEQKQVESILFEYTSKINRMQEDLLISVGGSNSEFMLPSFDREGQAVRNEIFASVKKVLSNATYARFLKYGEREIEEKFGYFGKCAYRYSFKTHGEYIALDVSAESQDLFRPNIQHFYEKKIPSKFSHLFDLND